MMNTKEQGKKKDKNQTASLRETRNSMLDEQSEEPQHQAKSKECAGTILLNDPMIFMHPQTNNNSTPSKQSTSNNPKPYSNI